MNTLKQRLSEAVQPNARLTGATPEGGASELKR